MKFDQAFDALIGHEKGFTDNPKDPGNWTGGRVGVGALKGTKYGIAASTYPSLDIRGLTIAAARRLPGEQLDKRLNGHRLRFLADLKVWPDFGRGWARRIATNLIED